MTVSPSPSHVASEDVPPGPEYARRGTPDAGFVTALLRQHRELAAYARMLAREHTEAEDLLQDTLERALRAARRFRPGTNLHAWLTRIMRNLFTDRCRRSALIRNVNALIVVPDVVTEPQPVSSLDLVSMADVDAALAEIGDDHRQVFELAYVRRLSYGAIAKQLQIPLSTVGTRLWRAKAKLRRALRKSERVAFPPAVAANDVGGDGRPRAPRRARQRS
jgi:RNA polymerase sigma-70 factor (ECF subfamily)